MDAESRIVGEQTVCLVKSCSGEIWEISKGDGFWLRIHIHEETDVDE